MKGIIVFLLNVLFSSVAMGLNLQPQTLTVDGKTVTLQVPAGMAVQFMAAINDARFPTLGPDNEMIIGSNTSHVYRLLPPYTSATNLVNLSNRSHSAVYRSGTLYVAAANGVYFASYTGASSSLSSGNFTKIFSFPTALYHTSRTIIVGPDGSLYVSIGILGDCSDEYLAGTSPTYPPDQRRGGVWRIDESGASPTLVAYSSGLRNPIGIAFNPTNNQLWATNAGPDNLGANLPREVFTRLSNGSWHGMPWFQYINGSLQAQDCITSAPPRPSSEVVIPSATFDARSTPQGIAFVTGNSLGSEFSGNALVAIHGSLGSNRAPKLVMVKFSGADPIGVEDAVTGFQYTGGARFARPSGAIMGPDGHFYFTSDGGDVEGLFRLINLSGGPAPDPAPAPGGTSSIIPSVHLLLQE